MDSDTLKTEDPHRILTRIEQPLSSSRPAAYVTKYIVKK
jgi:hypothetical protein